MLSADLGYAKSFGVGAAETAAAMTADAAGNTYVAGTFSGTTDFNSLPLVIVPATSVGGLDNFLIKYDPAGNIVWFTTFGSVNNDSISSVAVDASGNVYASGKINGTTDFIPGAGVFNINLPPNTESTFVLKLNSTGNFVWAKSFGDGGLVTNPIIAVDGSSNVYAAGGFSGTANFDTRPLTVTLLSSAGATDVFVAKLDSDGNSVWAKRLGGAGPDSASAVSVDGSGNVVVGGSFLGTVDFNPGAGTLNLVSAGASDGFVTKLDSAGELMWAKRLGGTGSDLVLGIALDVTGNVHVSGIFQGTADFDPGIGVFKLVSSAFESVFVEKLRDDGSFVWAKHSVAGATATTSANSRGITTDSLGNVYTTGLFVATSDFDPAASSFNLTSASANAADFYLSKLNSSGDFVWARRLGGAGSDVAVGIALDAANNVLTAGHFTGTSDFDPGSGISNLVSSGNASDVFVAKYVQTPFFTIPSDGESHNLTLRLNGTSVELFDNDDESVVASGLLANLIDVPIVGGSGEQDDALTIDYTFGGFFRLPGGIHFDGGSESLSDRVTVIGNQATQMFGSYTPSGSAPDAGSFSVTSVMPPNSTATTRVDFHGIETAEVANMSLMTFVTPNSSDNLTVSSAVGSNGSPANIVSGTSDGQFLSALTFFDVTSFGVQADVNDRTVPDDFVTIDSTPDFFETEGPPGEAIESLMASGLKNFAVVTGKGSDVLQVNLVSIALPVSGGTFVFDAGVGTDRIQAHADVNYTLTNAALTIPDDASIALTSVETASLEGGDGDNVVNALAFTGKTTLGGNGGDDVLTGGSKNDDLNGGDGDDTLTGGAGNDSLDGGDGDNSLVGGAGLDTLIGNGGNDTLRGGDGNDQLFDLEGLNLFDGGAGNDNMTGGDSSDTMLGGSGNDTINGSEGDDSIDGGSGNDLLNGSIGEDTLQGGTGRDDVIGDEGDDVLFGGADRDSLVGGVGNDTIDGGDGNDTLLGQSDDDSLIGGAGNDEIRAGTGSDTIDGGAGTDSYELDMVLTDLLINGEILL